MLDLGPVAARCSWIERLRTDYHVAARGFMTSELKLRPDRVKQHLYKPLDASMHCHTSGESRMKFHVESSGSSSFARYAKTECSGRRAPGIDQQLLSVPEHNVNLTCYNAQKTSMCLCSTCRSARNFASFNMPARAADQYGFLCDQNVHMPTSKSNMRQTFLQFFAAEERAFRIQ